MEALWSWWQTWSASVSEAVARGTSGLDFGALLALAAALGWASGLRLYAVVFLTGLAGVLGWIVLPTGLQVLMHPAVLGASGFMLVVEFFADKIPVVDSLWDSIQGFVRVPAGAALAAAVFGADSTAMALAAGLLGGSLAATSFATKAATRAAANTSPEPFSYWSLSLLEDGLVVGALWLATQHPVLFGIVLCIVVVLMGVLLWTLFRFLRAVVRRIGGLVGMARA